MSSTPPSPAPSQPAGADEATPSLGKRILADLPASFVVFLVAVPLSLGIALASNAPVMAGLIAAIVGGIVVGALAGAPLQVSGPAAGLVVMVFALTETLGDWRMVCAVIALAGLVQLAFGALGIARFALAISPAVVHGMLAGIGILIALSQIHVVLGGTPQSKALANLRDLPGQISDLHGASVGLGLFTIALLLAWPRLPWKRVRAIPAPLVAVVAATLLALAFGLEVATVDLSVDDHVHPVQAGHVIDDLPTTPAGDHGNLLAAIQLPRWPAAMSWSALLQAVFALAMIASVESLLCAVATDRLHPGKRANLNRELMAQGVGNTVSGLLGGLPVTGVIVRSSANIDAGGKTRASAMLHGLWVLVFIALFPFLVESIPKSVLAALLVLIGVKLVKLNEARTLREHGELPIYLITIAGVVSIDLLVGVGIGFACALARLLYRLGHLEVTIEEGQPSGAVGAHPWQVKVSGALSFLGVPKLTDALSQIPAGVDVAIDLGVESIDHAGWEALEGWRSTHERSGGQVEVEGLERVWKHAESEESEALPAAHESEAALVGSAS